MVVRKGPDQGVLANSNATNAASTLSNATALLLPRWRAGVAKVKANVSNARILCLGDSTTFGVWSAGGLLTGDMKPNAYPAQLARMLNASGVNAHANSMFSGGTASLAAPSNKVNDARAVFGSAWTNFGFNTFGGAYLVATTNTNAISFTPTEPVDTFNFFHPRKTPSSWGVIAADLNGGAATNFNTNSGVANTSYNILTLTTTLGINTANVKWSSGGTVFFGGVEAYDSNKKWVSVINAGRSGATAANLVVEDELYTSVAADLFIINLGINDWVQGVPVATFTANMQSIITKAKAGGDVLIVSPFPSLVGSGGAPATSVQDQYVNALFSLANSNNVPILDVYGRWVSYANSNPLGFYGDGLHPNQAGYADTAQAIFNLIGNV